MSVFGIAFFDRDNTLIEDAGYTHRVEDLAWRPGAIEAIRRCNAAGLRVLVVTNQSGIGRGLFTEAQMHALHEAMQADLDHAGARIDGFYICPYHPDGAIEAYRAADHPDRKPNPGLLRRALLEWGETAAEAFLIGNEDKDLQAAAAAGVAGFKAEREGLLDAVEQALARPSSPSNTAAAKAALKERANQAQAWLFEAALPLWWERGFDRATGCFFERLEPDGAPARLPRRVRVQARQAAVYAQAGRLGWPGPWRDALAAGLEALDTRCLRPDGGPRHLLDADGRPLDERPDLYDLAFLAYAYAEAALALPDRRDALAAKAAALIGWAQARWAHSEGGFFEGEVQAIPPRRQNPHMHLFEALLSLFEATRDPRHLAAATALARLFTERLVHSAHEAVPEYFDEAWGPAPGDAGQIAEPGHQFEWAWLLLRWRALGGEGPDTSALARGLWLHGEVYGVDLRRGLAIDEVALNGAPRRRTARLWPQTERLKANLAMIEAFDDPNAPALAVEAFDGLMRYCAVETPGLWWDLALEDGGFKQEAAPASSFYHIMVALSELIRVAALLP